MNDILLVEAGLWEIVLMIATDKPEDLVRGEKSITEIFTSL